MFNVRINENFKIINVVENFHILHQIKYAINRN